MKELVILQFIIIAGLVIYARYTYLKGRYDVRSEDCRNITEAGGSRNAFQESRQSIEELGELNQRAAQIRERAADNDHWSV